MSRSVKEASHKLKPCPEAREAIAEAKVSDPVSIERAGTLLRFVDGKGRLLGTLTGRSPVAKLLDAGEILLPCEVAWAYEASDRYPYGLASARVRFGDPDDPYVQWCLKNIWGRPREPRPPRDYAVNVVGQSHYQAAIARCAVGAVATLYREIGNPHDDRAIVVKCAGATIGYIPRKSWLHHVVHQDGSGADAAILSLHAGPPAAVVLSVKVRAAELPEMPYQPACAL